MQFRSICDLNTLVLSKLDQFPADIDLIVGVPRSGMLPASMLALHLGLPLTDVDGFLNKQIMQGGTTRQQKSAVFNQLKHALVIDDSVFSGGTFIELRSKLHLADFPNITYCAVYGSDEFTDGNLLTLETVSAPRAFEWNIMYHPFILAHACVDIDGIVCFDPSTEVSDGGNKYRQFARTARPRFLPHCEVGALVTSRLEKYRSETVKWLADSGIRYRELHMLDVPDEETRKRLGLHAKFKASVYKNSDAYVFIESEEWQARQIAQISGRPALCLNSKPQLCYGSMRNPQGIVWHMKKNPLVRSIFKK